MIFVNVEKTYDGKIRSFTMDGHADFADKGKDIVCAGASAVAFGSVNAIIALTGIEPEIEQSETGFLKCSFHTESTDESFNQVQLLLEGMIISLQTIERDYQDYIKITFS
ncbi:ribosomal-processing cysteine protease Prp [Bacillus sp. FJAT-49732]|uniref:Ribosomal processing cysteine protease Prp n=1 Tax=Lederbergia citrisecunda TaxID=2833583 RepID=A0A942YJX4_9BACI|nr:ribosomal-processing cysteine protease Prp [Lederbergia citrisecunda]MBS4199803.1 ribosomal-processing cysteine protease Prp [Lederbergia citrisecunda]